jgi:hypothetical protein
MYLPCFHVHEDTYKNILNLHENLDSVSVKVLDGCGSFPRRSAGT